MPIQAANTHRKEPLGQHRFSADRPIEQIDQDRLGRSFFAAQLADTICNWSGKDSLVLALYGAWGSGKTSVKNLFKCHCKTKGNPHVVEFSPWQWSAQGKIFDAFFQVVAERLERHDIAKESKRLAQKWKYFAACWGIGLEVGKHLYRSASSLLLVSALSAWVTRIPNPVVQVTSGVLAALTFVAGSLALALPSLFQKLVALFEARAAYTEKGAEERRNELIDELRRLKKPLVIVIDDFDRLTRDEVKIMIQLVKANTDLPNVVYILLCQEDSIAKALDDDPQRARDYLEKVIQVGFDIPEAQQSKLQKILLEQLEEIFAVTDVGSLWDKHRWDHVYKDYLKGYFRTLRDVYRFVGMMKFQVNLHTNKNVLEVNPIDLITLHTFRVFEHPIFERIRDSAVSDTNHFLETLFGAKGVQEGRPNIFPSQILEGVDQKKKENLQGMLTSLFPQASPNFRGDEAHWDRDLRICHPNHFPKYFEFSLRDGVISALEITGLIRSAGDPQAVATVLRNYIAAGRVTDLLDAIEPHIENVPAEKIGSLLAGFLQVSDCLPRAPFGSLSLAPVTQSTRLLRNSLARVPEGTRSDTIFGPIAGSDAFTLPAFIVHADEPNPNDPSLQHQPLLAKNDLTKLTKLVADKIKRAATENRLHGSEHFMWLLQCWGRWAGDGEAALWAKSFVKDPQSALTIAIAATTTGTITTHGQVRPYDTLLLQWLEHFIDLEVTWNHLTELDKATLPDREKHIIELYRRGLELRKQGQPYDRVQDKSDPFFGDY
jgi:hypothetical protein